jgi:hypothetical protein
MRTLEADPMSEPRFRLVRGTTHDGLSVPVWPTALDPFAVLNRSDGPWWSWRLLGANNRELGRGGSVHDSADECLTSLADNQAKVPLAKPVTLFVEGRWTWQFQLDGEPFAVAGRAYQRQRECRYGFGQFLVALVSTRVPADADGGPGEVDLPHRGIAPVHELALAQAGT